VIKDTIFAKYIEDRLGAKILENEFGFIFYIIKGAECFIQDMSIQESDRAKGKGRSLVYQLTKIAQDAGCEFLSANIHLFDKGANNTLIASMKAGFKVISAQNQILVITKDIKGVH